MADPPTCERDPRRDIVEYGRKLHTKGFVAATDGNLSARLPDGSFLATPTGTPKEELAPELLAELNREGEIIKGNPSSEWPMHFAIYRVRSDVRAIVHAHPPFATAMACSGRAVDHPFLSETVISLGNVPLVPFSLPSTPELAREVAESLRNHDAALLANHGAVTTGPDVRTAYYRLETLEQTAQILCYTEILGGGSSLPIPTVERLKKLGSSYGLAPAPCPADGALSADGGGERVVFTREELVALLVDFASLYCRK